MTDVVRFTPVAGTFERDAHDDPSAWYLCGPFMQFMAAHGFLPIDARDPFVWSSDLNGAEGWRRVVPFVRDRRGDMRDWIAGGKALRWRQSRFAYEDRGVIAYSHGGQIAAEACAGGLRIPFLVTVATPVRRDMRDAWRHARGNVGYWLHLRASVLDVAMLLGTLGDGAFSASQDMPLADENDGIETMRHGLILTDPRHIAAWLQAGWLDRIRCHVRALRSDVEAPR